jgi:hypothetical protein
MIFYEYEITTDKGSFLAQISDPSLTEPWPSAVDQAKYRGEEIIGIALTGNTYDNERIADKEQAPYRDALLALTEHCTRD